MRAVVTQDYGSAPAIVELDAPTPGPGEVRVKVRSSSMNGFDNALTRGYFNGVMEHRFPVVLGRDFAGVIDLVGDGVTDFAVDDEVFGVVVTQPLNAGAFADYMIIPQDHNIARIPAGLDHATAGVLGLAGAAAIAVTEAVGPQPGERVLVSGATGGVGAIVMQMLAAKGVIVIATASGPVEAEHVAGLGATHVVDPDDLANQLAEIAPGGVDVVIHLAGDPAVLCDLLAEGGRFSTLLMAAPPQASERGITVAQPYATPHRAVLESLATDVLAGRLRVPVQRAYDLADVPRAFRDFAAGTLGKLAIVVSE